MDTPGCGTWFRVWTVLLQAGGKDKDGDRRIWVAWLCSKHLSVAESLKNPVTFTDVFSVLLQKHKHWRNLFCKTSTLFKRSQIESYGHCNMLPTSRRLFYLRVIQIKIHKYPGTKRLIKSIISPDSHLVYELWRSNINHILHIFIKKKLRNNKINCIRLPISYKKWKCYSYI